MADSTIKQSIMTNLIDKNDSLWFAQTSNKPYDRHHYKVISKSGETNVLTSYDEVIESWWNKRHFIDRIEVIDKPKKRGKGF